MVVIDLVISLVKLFFQLQDSQPFLDVKLYLILPKPWNSSLHLFSGEASP